MCRWRSEDNFSELVLSTMKVVKLGDKCLYSQAIHWSGDTPPHFSSSPGSH